MKKLIALVANYHQNSGRSYAKWELFETEIPNNFSELHFKVVADDYTFPDCERKYWVADSDGLPAEMTAAEKAVVDTEEAARQEQDFKNSLIAKLQKRQNFTSELVAEVWISNEVNNAAGSFAHGQLQKLSPVRELLGSGMFETGLALLNSLEVDQYLTAESKAYFASKIETFLANE